MAKNDVKTETANKAEAASKTLAAVNGDVYVEEESGTGSIKISENVISAVVRKYTLEVPGVVRFSSNSPFSGLAEIIGRRNQEANILVDIEGDTVTINVNLVLEFGTRVPEVAGMVQDVIRSRVEELTGKHVTAVNVIVQDLEEVSAKAEKAVKAAASE